MNKFLLLVGIQLKDGFFRASNSLGIGNKRKIGIFLYPFLLFAFSTVSFQLSYQYHIAYQKIGAPELTITSMYMVSCFFIFLLSVSTIMGTLFYSKDTLFYTSLPVNEKTIVFSKLAIQYLVAFIINLVFLGPAMIIYWGGNDVLFISYINGIIILLITPLMPVLVATLLVMAGMKAVSRYASRNSISVIFSILLILVIFGLQILISRQAVDEDLMSRLTQEDGLLKIISRSFPPSLWATKMFVGDLLETAYFLILNFIILAVLYISARPLFRRVVGAFTEGSSRKIIKNGSLAFISQSQLISLVKRQLYIILKTPTFILNISMLILLPFILIIIWSLSGVMNIQELLKGPLSEYTAYIFVVLIASPAIMGTFSATAITREGKYLWQIKCLPVTATLDLLSRITTSVVLCFIGLAPVIVLSLYLLDIGFYTFVVGFIAGIIITVSFSVLDLIIDIYRPILNWTNPTHAVKNNMNIMIAMSFRLVIGFIIFSTRSVWFPLAIIPQMMIFAVFFAVVGVLAYLFIVKTGTKVYGAIET